LVAREICRLVRIREAKTTLGRAVGSLIHTPHLTSHTTPIHEDYTGSQS